MSTRYIDAHAYLCTYVYVYVLVWQVLSAISKSGYDKPFPIQMQMLPVIMSGRDCIG